MAKQGLVAKTRDRYRQTSNRCKGRILKSSPKGLWPCRTRGAGPRVHGQRLASSGSLTMHDNYLDRRRRGPGFCSLRCRVAAHRSAKRSAQELRVLADTGATLTGVPKPETCCLPAASTILHLPVPPPVRN